MNKSSRRTFIKSAAVTGMLAPFVTSVFAVDNSNEKKYKRNIIDRDEKDNYLETIKAELIKEWPKNRTINLVFHGHSVPSGYFVTPDVKPLRSYSFLLLKELKKIYSLAVAAASLKAWEYMIKAALKKNIKIILLTATPDQRVDLLSKETDLQKICNQVIELSKQYQTGLVDKYTVFQQLISSGGKITNYMSQVNHPNEKGHQLVVDGMMKYF